ncbi:MAG: molybdopterin molybdotransferase MoeA [bacterium]|nr:molybdopterin molybdotransferase MoeA [bacterium]
MISIEQALRTLRDAVEPLGTEELALERAAGRVLAETLAADRDFPPTDRSAMDGFALRSADAAEPGVTLDVVAEVRAGQSAAGVSLGRGQAARIFTGGVVPDGADCVVMVEDTSENEARTRVTLSVAVPQGRHVRPRGQDLERGGTVLWPGMPIHAAEAAALASLGRERVAVHRSPRVSVLSTGDEIVEPGETPLAHQVRNSNAPTLIAQLLELGVAANYLGIAGDRRDELDRMLASGLDSDLLLITGGVSVGEYDLVGRALEDLGMQLLFHKVAVKPGKPILAGRRGACLVVGLPGNPVSTYAGFAVFVAPALRKMMGFAACDNLYVDVELDDDLRAKPGRVTYHLASVWERDGRLLARGVQASGSGDVLAMARANAFVVTGDQSRGHAPGETVRALLWRDFPLRVRPRDSR